MGKSRDGAGEGGGGERRRLKTKTACRKFLSTSVFQTCFLGGGKWEKNMRI